MNPYLKCSHKIIIKIALASKALTLIDNVGTTQTTFNCN
jgi:hypothetical protein